MTTHNDHTPDACDRDTLLTGHALNDLSEREQGQVEQLLAADPQAGQTVEEVKRLATALRETCAEPAGTPSAGLREAVVARLDELDKAEGKVAIPRPEKGQWRKFVVWGSGALALSLAVGFGGYSAGLMSTHSNSQVARLHGVNESSKHAKKTASKTAKDQATDEPVYLDSVREAREVRTLQSEPNIVLSTDPTGSVTAGKEPFDAASINVDVRNFGERTAPRNDLAKSIGTINGTGVSGRPDGNRKPLGATTGGTLSREKEIAGYHKGQVKAYYDHAPWQPVHSTSRKGDRRGDLPGQRVAGEDGLGEGRGFGSRPEAEGDGSGEQYEAPPENAFLPVDKTTALSTFSIDVDTASYANVRRFLSQSQLPPPHAVRIEEMLNYFRYSYPPPQGDDPFSVSMELADCPWQPGHELLRIGIKGKEVQAKERKAGNLVFLVDVSGSMQPENKLPLLKQALKMLTGELTENDTVTIVTYAGDAGLKLEATNGSRQNEIRAAIDSLSAGGSTHGSAGIELAYQQAAKSFIKGGTNRVILATDGDLNVGITSDDALVELIKSKAAGGVFLTVLGVGEGNLKDAKMEKLADNGNGVYAYLDSLREARKVLVEQLAGSLETIAKDVKIQIEFNPTEVQAYRLIGYENRMLATRDFSDDKKDAGEIGAGHTVTALYELVPAKAKAAAKAEARGEGEPLKYQKTPEVKPAPEALTPAAGSGEALTLKLRYKDPAGETSKLREFPLKSEAVRFNRASADFQFAAAVASFGMLLKNSQHRGDATFSAVEEIAAGAIGPDAGGYRAEFLDMVRKAKTLK